MCAVGRCEQEEERVLEPFGLAPFHRRGRKKRAGVEMEENKVKTLGWHFDRIGSIERDIITIVPVGWHY